MLKMYESRSYKLASAAAQPYWSSGFFHKGPSTALLSKSGDNCTTAAAAMKPATLPASGKGSDVLLTIGPIPKLMNSKPHNGANNNDHTHFLRTGPAPDQQLLKLCRTGGLKGLQCLPCICSASHNGELAPKLCTTIIEIMHSFGKAAGYVILSLERESACTWRIVLQAASEHNYC